jgi:hypothetical protein
MEGRPRKFAALSGTVICLMLFVHVVLGLIISIAPEASKGRPLLKFYRRFVVLGPFFQEPRIVTAPHVWVSFHEHGVWSDGVELNGRAVNETPTKYAAAQYRTFENYLGELAARAKQRGSGRKRAIKELEDYFNARTSGRTADSLNIIYVRQGAPGCTACSDTVYQHKFKR